MTTADATYEAKKALHVQKYIDWNEAMDRAQDKRDAADAEIKRLEQEEAGKNEMLCQADRVEWADVEYDGGLVLKQRRAMKQRQKLS